MILTPLPNNIPSVVPTGYIRWDSKTDSYFVYDGKQWVTAILSTQKWKLLYQESNKYVLAINDSEIREWLRNQPREEWEANWNDDNYVLSANLFCFFKLKFEE